MSLSIGTKATLSILAYNAASPAETLANLEHIPESEIPSDEMHCLKEICLAALEDNKPRFDAAMAKLKEIAAR